MDGPLVTHTIPQDLPTAQSRRLMIEQLEDIQELGHKIFKRIEAAVQLESEKLSKMEGRLSDLEGEIAGLKKHCSKTLKATAPVHYPAGATTHRHVLLFEDHQQVAGRLDKEQLEDADPSGLTKDHKAKELYAIFKQATLQQPNTGIQNRDMRREVDHITDLFTFNVRNLTSRLQNVGSAADSVTVPVTSQADALTSANVHLAVPSLTSSFNRPMLGPQESKGEETGRSTPLREMGHTGSDASSSQHPNPSVLSSNHPENLGEDNISQEPV